MRRKQFSEDQIVRILEEFEQGKSVEELCREYNVARSTIYMWRKKYGGIDKPMLKKLKELQKENDRLKKIVVQQALDIDGFAPGTKITVLGIEPGSVAYKATTLTN